MSDHFIKNIEIKNFKCFKDFKAEGFGRVNLIGGKNNVGKTAFMEAVFISINDISMNKNTNVVPFFSYLFTIRDYRKKSQKYDFQEIISIFRKFNNLKIKTNKSETTMELEDNIVDVVLSINGSRLKVDSSHQQGIDYSLHNDFIPSSMKGYELILSLFEDIIEELKEEELNNILKEFDKDILKFSITKKTPKVYLESIENWRDISELGHGLGRYIAIISSILINKDGFLFLDELDNGIHYTHLDKLWEIILTISKQQNVQVFATTHSKECIESYARVAKKRKENENDEDITFIELGQNDENKIESIIYSYEWLIDEVSQNHEVRGW